MGLSTGMVGEVYVIFCYTFISVTFVNILPLRFPVLTQDEFIMTQYSF